MYRFILQLYYVATVPIAIFFILNSTAIHPAYKLGFFRKQWLGWCMFINKLRVPTGTSYKSHLAMALKVFEEAPDTEGCIVECGTWKGGSAVNLSLVCKMTGRKLIIYDSFEGLPEGRTEDRQGFYETGDYRGPLEEVQANLKRFGSIEVCEFRKGLAPLKPKPRWPIYRKEM